MSNEYRLSLRRVVTAIGRLGQLKGNRTLFEINPSKDTTSFAAWEELNNAIKEAKECLQQASKTNVSTTFRSDQLHEVSCCYAGGPGAPYYQPTMNCSCGFSSGRCENWEEAGQAMDIHIAERRASDNQPFTGSDYDNWSTGRKSKGPKEQK